MSSVALGMWAGAFILAMYTGMGDSRLRIAIDHEVSHIQVHHPLFADDLAARYSFAADSMAAVLRSVPNIQAFSLRSVSAGMIATASGSRGIQINGIDPAQENTTRPLASFIKEGKYLDSSQQHRVLVSVRLSEKMNLKLGQKIVLTLLDTSNTITTGAFRVGGIFESENSTLDERNVFVPKNELDALAGTEARAHEAAVFLKKDTDLDTVYQQLKKRLPDLKVESWQELSPETALVYNSMESYAMIFVTIILLALSFGIVNTMLMAVLERTRELGVLMAVGMNKFRVFSMVVLETVLLSFIGCPIGLGIAWLTCKWLGRSGIDMGSVAKDVLKGYGYAEIIYPKLPATGVGHIVWLVLLAALLSAIFPAIKALRLRPVEAIH